MLYFITVNKTRVMSVRAEEFYVVIGIMLASLFMSLMKLNLSGGSWTNKGLSSAIAITFGLYCTAIISEGVIERHRAQDRDGHF